MKLEVGMYVRTPKGIAKIEEITEDRTEIYFNCDTGLSISFIKKDFTQEEMAEFYKHSYNIIGLIEVGDYVNGKLVSSLPLFKNEFIFEEPVNGVKYVKGIVGTPIEDNKDNFIKTIVTKERFESMSYKVGE